MPMHDWNRVDAGIYHAFHHEWISEIQRALNRGILPADHYALPEQCAAGFGPDVLTLQHSGASSVDSGSIALKSRPTTRFTAETATDFYLRKQKVIAVRHVSGDEIVAMIEIVSPGNDKQLTIVSHECALNAIVTIEPISVGDSLPDMPLFLKTDGCVTVPLETTYCAAFDAMPRRWRDVLEVRR